jgi:hypothetical protein
MTYQEIKEKAVYIICALLMFVVGFGTGRAWHKPAVRVNTKTPSNYSAKAPEKPQKAEAKPAPKVTQPEVSAKDNSTAKTECKIKGNISGSRKIYHVPGGAFYERTTPEQCFATEGEAENAGFKKSGR